jgi:hypothetical protein
LASGKVIPDLDLIKQVEQDPVRGSMHLGRMGFRASCDQHGNSEESKAAGFEVDLDQADRFIPPPTP